jgi:hypothetical protein
MPLLLFCPCGHSGPLPEATGRYRCSACGETQEVTWFAGPDVFGQWHRWRNRKAPPASGLRVEFVAEKGT